MRRAFATAVIALTFVTLPSAAVGVETRAAQGETIACLASPYPLSVSPGLTTVPSEKTTFKSTAPSVVDCQGSVQGRQVTGRGKVTIEEAVAVGATCQNSSGKGRAVFTVPTADGPVQFVNNFTYEHAGLAGTFTGELLSGVFIFSPPTKGDCTSEPLTVVTVTFAGIDR